MTARRTILFCLLSALLGTLLSGTMLDRPEAESQLAAQERFGGSQVSMATAARAQPKAADTPGYDALTPEERVNIAVYEKVNRSVVNISTKSVRTDAFFWMEVPSEGAASGAVIDHEGHILTNFHVIDDAREIRVALYDGNSYEARLIGVDPTTDVAVLKIDAAAETLYPVVFGDSSHLLVGQRVYALGNPFGLERTLTTGIISSLNRDLPSRRRYRKITQVIQIDAAINPGNSGGPLLDTGGRMIGMNTAIASRTGESAGVGFAIPVNTITRVVTQLIEKGRVVRADVGIAKVYQTDEGLLIAALTPDGAAQQAGLKGFRVVTRQKRQGLLVWQQTYVDRSPADLIVGVDGRRIQTVEEFLSIIESKQPGQQVTINVVRDGQQVGIPVPLDAGE